MALTQEERAVAAAAADVWPAGKADKWQVTRKGVRYT
jgi:hypothetical protein